MAVERFEVGKTYRHDGTGEPVTPTLVGTPLGPDSVGGTWQWVEWDYSTPGTTVGREMRLRAWSEVPTYPERWCNVYEDGIAPEFTTRAEADQFGVGRIGVIHLRPDGTTTMEAP